MKRNISITIILIFVNFGILFSQEVDIKSLNLHGSIKSIREITSVNYSKQEIKLEQVSDNYNEFDTLARNLKHVNYNKFGNVHKKMTYKYNSYNKLIETSFYSDINTISTITVYEYKNDTNLLKKTITYPNPDYNKNNIGLVQITEDTPQKQLEKYVLSPFIRNTYNYNNSNQLIESIEYNSDGSFSVKHIYKYDINAKLIELKSFRTDGSTYNHLTYKYDRNGREVESNNFASYSRHLPSKTTTIYNDMDLIQKIEYDFKGKLITIQNYTNNRITDRKDFTSNGDLNLITIFKYDRNGVIVNSHTKDTLGKTTEKIIYNYKKSKLTEEITYNGSSEIIEKHVLNYDKNENIILDNYYNYTSNFTLEQIFTYEYNNQGDWIKKISYKNGLLYSKTERKIEYY